MGQEPTAFPFKVAASLSKKSILANFLDPVCVIQCSLLFLQAQILCGSYPVHQSDDGILYQDHTETLMTGAVESVD